LKTLQNRGIFAAFALAPTGGGSYVPVMSVGRDGLLRAQFWMGEVKPITSKVAVNDERWHHACLVADGPAKLQTLYLDGSPIGTLAGELKHLTMLDNQVGTALTASNWPGGNGAWFGFKGPLAEVRVWHRALSAAEVQYVRERTLRGWEPGLALYFPLDEAEGEAITDRSPWGHKASITNIPAGQKPRRTPTGPPVR
jgi:hypothetical protein